MNILLMLQFLILDGSKDRDSRGCVGRPNGSSKHILAQLRKFIQAEATKAISGMFGVIRTSARAPDLTGSVLVGVRSKGGSGNSA